MDLEDLPPIKARRPRRWVLSICGGGYAGLFAAEFLRRLETRLDAKAGNVFDLVAGASIGGILALGLAKGIPAAALSDLLQGLGPHLFDKPAKGLLKAKHDPVALKTKLAEVFGKDTLAALRTQVLIPAVSLTAGETLLFRNAADDPTRTRLAVDVAMATSAAPVFLPPHAADERLYADGGLVANSPESVAAADALSRRRWTRGRTSMLVVGSTRKDARVAGHQMAGRWGLSDWGLQLLDSTMASQMSLARQMAQHILGADNHFVVEALLSPADEKVVDLDKATPKATQALKTLAAEAYTRFERDEAALLEQLAGA